MTITFLTPEKIELEGKGAAFINYGYSPYWKSSGNGYLAPTAPGLLYARVDGKLVVEFR